MITVTRSLTLAAPCEAVFAAVSEPARFPALYERTARWERVDGQGLEVGSRHVVLVHAGSVVVRSVMRVDRHEPPRVLAWSSVAGIEQEGHVELTPVDGGTHVTISTTVTLPGRLFGRIAERYLARILAPRIDAALLALKRHVVLGDARA